MTTSDRVNTGGDRIMKLLRNISKAVPYAIVLCLASLIVYFTLVFIRAFAASPAAVQAAVIGGIATVLVSVASVISTNKAQKRREIEAEHRKQKAEIYEEFMKFWFDLITREKLDRPPMSEKDMLEFVAGFSQRMIVWGSDEVVREYLAMKTTYQDGDGESHKSMMLRFESMMFAMRRDLGHDNKGMEPTSLLRLFITDVDEVWGTQVSGSLGTPTQRQVAVTRSRQTTLPGDEPSYQSLSKNE